MATKYFKIDLFVNAGCVLNTSKKKVVVDTYAAGVRFDAGATYTMEYEAGFVKGTGDNEFLSPANTNAGSFTTNSTGPQVQTDEPTDGGTSVTNNSFIRYTYDRQILAGNGNYYLYKVGSPDVLLQTYNPSDSTANNIISGNQITLNTVGLIDANETYYVLIDQGAVEDKDGLAAFGFNNDQEHRWTTAPSTNVDFPDLTSLKVSSATLSCTITKNPNYEYGEANLSSTFTSTLTGDPIYKAITNMTNARSYVREQGTEIFSTNTPQIDEPPTSTVTSYTIQFNSSNGEFGDTDDMTVSYTTYTFTGTMTQCNAQFQKILFYPDASTSAGAPLSMTYTQKQDGITQLTKTVTLNNTSNAIDNTIQYHYITTSGTYTPTVQQYKYKQFDYVAVGGGGGGAGVSNLQSGGNISSSLSVLGGGGGGGEVKTSLGNDFGITGTGPYSFSNTSISVTIGAGGSLGGTDQSGGNGGTTTLVLGGTTTITCAGGDGGYASGTSSGNTGGDEGGNRYSGGTQFTGNAGYKHGGNGAGAGDIWMDTGTINRAGITGDFLVSSTSGQFGQQLGPGWNTTSGTVSNGVTTGTLTNWGDQTHFGNGGGCGSIYGGGYVYSGDSDEQFPDTLYYTHPATGVRYYMNPNVDAYSQYPAAGGTLKPRGQGGAGSGKEQGLATTVREGHEGMAGCVALKIF